MAPTSPITAAPYPTTLFPTAAFEVTAAGDDAVADAGTEPLLIDAIPEAIEDGIAVGRLDTVMPAAAQRDCTAGAISENMLTMSC